MPDFTWERPPVVRPYIRIAGLSFRRIYDGSVIVQLGAEYSTRLTPTEWGQIVEAMRRSGTSVDEPSNDGIVK